VWAANSWSAAEPRAGWRHTLERAACDVAREGRVRRAAVRDRTRHHTRRGERRSEVMLPGVSSRSTTQTDRPRALSTWAR
jgi:hypothetical protein